MGLASSSQSAIGRALDDLPSCGGWKQERSNGEATGDWNGIS